MFQMCAKQHESLKIESDYAILCNAKPPKPGVAPNEKRLPQARQAFFISSQNALLPSAFRLRLFVQWHYALGIGRQITQTIFARRMC